MNTLRVSPQAVVSILYLSVVSSTFFSNMGELLGQTRTTLSNPKYCSHRAFSGIPSLRHLRTVPPQAVSNMGILSISCRLNVRNIRSRSVSSIIFPSKNHEFYYPLFICKSLLPRLPHLPRPPYSSPRLSDGRNPRLRERRLSLFLPYRVYLQPLPP